MQNKIFFLPRENKISVGYFAYTHYREFRILAVITARILTNNYHFF